MVAIASSKTGRKAAKPRSTRVAAVAPPRVRRLKPEGCIVLPSINWKTYLGIDKAFGHDSRPGMRLNYLGGALEIMTTSSDHERIKKIIGRCIEHFCDESDIWFSAQGQMTRQVAEDRAAEADESYSFDRKNKQVGLVLEVCISSGGISKLALYEALGHPEVWLWRKGKIEPHAWIDGAYRRVSKSTALPSIDIKLIEELSLWKDDCLAVREYKRRLATKRTKH